MEKSIQENKKANTMTYYREVIDRIDLRQLLCPGRTVSGDRPIMQLCPWHEEKHPSCAVYKSRIHCFACGKSKSTLEWIAEKEGIDIEHEFGKVVEVAARKYIGTFIPDTYTKPKTGAGTWAGPSVFKKPLSPEFVTFGHDNLGDKRQWFLSRGISNAVIDEMLLGYHNNAFTIPIWHADGKTILTIRYRRDDLVTKAGNKYWGIKGRNETHVFNGQALTPEFAYMSDGIVVITEGELDCLRLWSEGICSVSFTNGVSAWKQIWRTPESICAFQNFNHIIIAFDRDNEGERNAREFIDSFVGRATMLTWDANLGKDITDLCHSIGGKRVWDLIKENVRD